MNKKIIYIGAFLFLIPLLSLRLYSGEAEKIKPSIQLKYFKNTNDQSILVTTLTYSKNRMELPLGGMEISFFSGQSQKNLIATVLTDKQGVAKLDLNGDNKLKAGKDEIWSFNTEFHGNDTIEGGISEITVKDLKMEMELTQADSIKTVTIKVFTEEGGKEKPVSGESVNIYVPRMFSLLPVGQLTLDDAGTASMEFPSDLPGDKKGNLVVIAKIEENETFGNVEKRDTINWGSPTDYSVPVTHRALWTTIAPKWMIYTLSVLLAGVWGHYLFAIISLIRIKIDASRKKAEEEYRT